MGLKRTNCSRVTFVRCPSIGPSMPDWPMQLVQHAMAARSRKSERFVLPVNRKWRNVIVTGERVNRREFARGGLTPTFPTRVGSSSLGTGRGTGPLDLGLFYQFQIDAPAGDLGR